MVDSKLIILLRGLIPVELRYFKEYIHSPYFNKNKRLCRLVDILYSTAPDFNHESLAKEHLFAKLFPGEPYKDQKLRDLISHTVQFLEDFLAIENYRKQSGL